VAVPLSLVELPLRGSAALTVSRKIKIVVGRLDIHPIPPPPPETLLFFLLELSTPSHSIGASPSFPTQILERLSL